MKKIILMITILGLLSINAYEINFSKSFTTKVSPDILSTRVYIDVDKKDEIKVTKVLDKFSKFFKEIKKVKLKDGSYTISPRYKYKKNEAIFMGYNGSLRYKVEAKNTNDINNFISSLISLKKDKNLDDVKLEVSNVNWEVSENLYKTSKEDLRMKTILWVNSYVKKLSKKLDTKCKIKVIDVNLQGRNINYYRNTKRAYSSKMASLQSDITPLRSDENININSNFSLECK